MYLISSCLCGVNCKYNGSNNLNETCLELLKEGKAVLEHMKSFDKVRPMIDKGEYMYVNNVYDNMIQWNG